VTRARTTAFLVELLCEGVPMERIPRSSLGLDVLVASEREPLLLRWDPKRPDGDSLRLTNIRENRENWYISARDIAREDAGAMMTRCERAHHNGSDDLVRSDCGAALRTEDPAQLGRAALLLGKMHAAHRRREEAIEWYLTARLSLPADSPAHPEVARSLESLCELSSRLKREPGDPRTFKVVSWHWQDRKLAFKNEPSMNSPTMTKLFLQRGTCVLAGEIKETTEAGRTNRWVDVEVDLPGAPFSRGWSHSDWLEPR
jgi:hypothetical protein